MQPNSPDEGLVPPSCSASKQFLKALSAGASVSGAAWAAGRARSTFYRWRRRYPEFLEAWDMAVDAGTDRLEDEAFLRATKGRSKPVFYGGRLIGHERRHSDTLLMFLLKARRPEKFDPGNTMARPAGRPGAVTSQFLDRIAKLLEPAGEQEQSTEMKKTTPNLSKGKQAKGDEK